MDTLKPCPFCGSKQTIKEIAQDGVPGYMLQHMCCMIRPSWWTIKEEAIKAWNNRPLEDAIEAIYADIVCGANAKEIDMTQRLWTND